LLSVPEFYNQVLHLMNKMNLPPPFLDDSPSVPFIDSGSKKRSKKRKMNMDNSLSENESEIESDNEDYIKKRKIELTSEIKSIKNKSQLVIEEDSFNIPTRILKPSPNNELKK